MILYVIHLELRKTPSSSIHRGESAHMTVSSVRSSLNYIVAILIMIKHNRHAQY